MGKSLSKLQQVEKQLQTVAFKDLHDGVCLSLGLQSLVFYLGLGLYFQNCFDDYTKAGGSKENRDVEYAKKVVKDAFSGFSINFAQGLAHQAVAASLISRQLKNHRPLLPVVLLASSSSLLYTCIAWFHPVKLLASVEALVQGQTFSGFSLQYIFETLSDRQSRFLMLCHFSGTALMLAALLQTRVSRVLVAAYVLFEGERSRLYLRTK